MRAPHDVLGEVSPERLRARRSAKWATHPEDVLPAWVAETDFQLAPAVRLALEEAIANDDCGYAFPAPLGPAFAAFAERRFGWRVEPGRVRLVPDVMSAVAALLHAFAPPGGGVVVTPPVYPPFFSVVGEVGRRLVEAPLAAGPSGWELDLDAIERAFSGGCAAFLLCNPHNPTGLVLGRETLEAVVALAGRYGVLVVADEIHAPLTLPGATHVPYLALGEEAAATGVSLTGSSKAWNVPGLKCGVLVSGSDAMDARLGERLPRSLPFHAGHLGVVASVAAFSDDGVWLDALLDRLDGNRRLLAELLERELPAVAYAPPEAGYLAWLDCRELGLGDDPAATFLERGRVALSPGPTFGTQGRGHARLNFGTSPELLEEIVRRMARALRSA